MAIFLLPACASPEGAVEMSIATATAAVGASGPPALRIATIGIGPTPPGASSVAMRAITPSATVRATEASQVSGRTPVVTNGSVVAAGSPGTSRATGTLVPGTPPSTPRAAPRGTPEPGVLLDPKGRYSFRVPTLWRAQTPMATGVDLEVVCDDPNGLLRITSVDTSAAVTLDSATTTISDALKKNTASYEPVPNGSLNAMIGGQPARRIEYYGIYSGTRLHYVSYVIVYNGKTVVTLLFVAQPDNFDRLLMQGNTVLTTFAFLQPG